MKLLVIFAFFIGASSARSFNFNAGTTNRGLQPTQQQRASSFGGGGNFNKQGSSFGGLQGRATNQINLQSSGQFNRGRADPIEEFTTESSNDDSGSDFQPLTSQGRSGFGSSTAQPQQQFNQRQGSSSNNQQGRSSPSITGSNSQPSITGSNFQQPSQQSSKFQTSAQQQQGRSGFGGQQQSNQNQGQVTGQQGSSQSFSQGRSNFGSTQAPRHFNQGQTSEQQQFNKGQATPSSSQQGRASTSNFQQGQQQFNQGSNSGQDSALEESPSDLEQSPEGRSAIDSSTDLNAENPGPLEFPEGRSFGSSPFNKGQGTNKFGSPQPARKPNFQSSNKGQTGFTSSPFQGRTRTPRPPISTATGSNFGGESGSTDDTSILRSDFQKSDRAFQWDFESSDGTIRKEEGELRQIGDYEGIAVKGEYSYVGPDGNTYMVSYIADENGFRPTGVHLYSVHAK